MYSKHTKRFKSEASVPKVTAMGKTDQRLTEWWTECSNFKPKKGFEQSYRSPRHSWRDDRWSAFYPGKQIIG